MEEGKRNPAPKSVQRSFSRDQGSLQPSWRSSTFRGVVRPSGVFWPAILPAPARPTTTASFILLKLDELLCWLRTADDAVETTFNSLRRRRQNCPRRREKEKSFGPINWPVDIT